VTLDLVLVGFGNVGRRFVRLLNEIAPRLAKEHALETRVVGIATRSRGCAHGADGLDGAALADRVEGGGRLGRRESTRAFLRAALRRNAAAARARRLVVVEVTTLDVERGQPAVDHVKMALAGRAHVVTANKGPAAFAYRALERTARRVDRRFLFESAVMDGVPVFNLARAALPGVTVDGFRGVVNSTTNYMLTAMESGDSFERALATMQERGIAEADPSLDIDGWDAAAKTAALANVLLGAALTPHTIEREGVSADAGAAVAAARAAGRKLKLVASAERAGASVRGRVRLVELPATDQLAGIDGPQNALILQTDLLGEISIVQRGSGLTATAYGLVADLVAIAREVSPTRATRPQPTRARRRRSPSPRGRRRS
jgi:homoserine dehydrogenase